MMLDERILDTLAAEPQDAPLTDLALAIKLQLSPPYIRKFRRRYNIPMAHIRRAQYQEEQVSASNEAMLVRAEQDAAYEASLKQDSERAEREAQREAERETQREAERETQVEAEREAERLLQQQRFIKSEEGRVWVREQRLKYFRK